MFSNVQIALMIKNVLKTHLWNKFHDIQILHFQAYIHKKSHLQKKILKGLWILDAHS